MESNKNIEYILDAVVVRGYNNNSSDCNDFVELIQKKDFKDLIALELYESYFWDERHEFDLQLLNEIVESVSAFYRNPDIIMQIKAGLLQTIPSAIIIAMVTNIWKKIKTVKIGHSASKDENSSWIRIEMNVKKIDKEFSTHNYVLTEEIERIFNTSREEIQPLLKLCGCKCFINKNRSIWIKAGLQNENVREILKRHHFMNR